MLYLFILALIRAQLSGCDVDLNGEDDINEECNFTGQCQDALLNGFKIGTSCLCCDVTEGPADHCEGSVPGSWEGTFCRTANFYTQVSWGYIIEDAGDEITCADDGTSTSVPDLIDVVTELILPTYHGEILTLPCEICTPSAPCSFFDPAADSGIFVKFATDINTFYDIGCSWGDLPDSIRDCAANWDKGATGYLKMLSALDQSNRYLQHLSDVQALVASEGGNGLGWSPTSINRVWHQSVSVEKVTVQTTRLPTPYPTRLPTAPPTNPPTEYNTIGDGVCEEYVNNVNNLVFLSAGSSCRANINESWTGGRTCESPYIVCLPMENTPADDIMGNPYKNKTHRYSVSECLQECAYDQRCLGVEFVADGGSALGDCNLIDEIPIAAEDPEYSYDYNAADTSLDKNTTGGDALCWAKGGDNYCNPYFEAEDLNDVMLKCYCPNNRKGSYTKKVKRTVNNTRFCGNDSLVEERLKKAQANRMFHLCENWCLFETLNPEGENWYWDPWKTCWRETYSGVGMHNSYCDRVIRNPNTIEMKFLSERRERFCDATSHPTYAPISGGYNWTLAGYRESCDDACSATGAQCAEEATATVFETEAELASAFEDAGHVCDPDRIRMNDTNWEGWALPGLRGGMVCANRLPTLSHLEKLDTDCSRILGGGWQRLCACFDS